MPEAPHRETMSSLLATRAAIRIARDVGYKPIDLPKPAIPQPSEPATVPVGEFHVDYHSDYMEAGRMLARAAFYFSVVMAIFMAIVIIALAIEGTLTIPRLPLVGVAFCIMFLSCHRRRAERH
jgi:hypothetical protein